MSLLNIPSLWMPSKLSSCELRESYREPGDGWHQNREVLNAVESSRVRTKLLKGSMLQIKGKVMVHFSVWLAATLESELPQQVPTSLSVGTAKHQNAHLYSIITSLNPINSTSPPPVTVSFLALGTSGGVIPFRIKRLMGLANSQEVEGRGEMLFQYSFEAIMKCRVKTLRNPWPLSLAHYYFSLYADFKISARVGAML